MNRHATFQTRLAMLAALSYMAAGAASAQSYPNHPIRLIVPFTSGGGVDIVARAMAQKMSDSVGQSIVIDNRAGGGTTIGLEMTARAAPDGYTIIMSSNALVINPSVYKKLPYDPVKDFAPVSQTSNLPLILVTRPSLKVNSLREFIAFAKSQNGKLTYATSGVGGSVHLAMELFKSMTGIQAVHVPYKTTSQKNVDIISGQVDVMFAALPSVTAQVRAGQMRALAVSGLKRSSALPDVPTVSEAGVPGYDCSTWNGILAPADTPAEIIERLNSEIRKALGYADVKARLAADGSEVVVSSPAEFAAFIRAEIAKYAKLVALVGIPKQ